MGARACAGDSGRKGEQRPGGDIVDGRSGHGQCTDGSLQHPAFDEDPREHREGGDRHRDAHEQCKRQVVDIGREQRIDDEGGQEPEGEREGNAHVRDEERLTDALPQDARVELHPDEEEVEGEPDLCGTGQERDDVGGEEVGLDLGRDRSEQRRAEQDAGQDFAHHLRLAHSAECGTGKPRREDDGRDRKHQPAERLLTGAFLRRGLAHPGLRQLT